MFRKCWRTLFAQRPSVVNCWLCCWCSLWWGWSLMINLSWKCVHGIFRFLCCGMAFWKQKKKHSCFQRYIGIPKPMLKRFRLEKSGLPDNLFIPEALTCQNTAVDIPHEQPEQFEKQRPKKTPCFQGCPKPCWKDSDWRNLGCQRVYLLKNFDLSQHGNGYPSWTTWTVTSVFPPHRLKDWPICNKKPFKTGNELRCWWPQMTAVVKQGKLKPHECWIRLPSSVHSTSQHSATPRWSAWKACEERDGTRCSAWNLQCSPSLRRIMMQYIYILSFSSLYILCINTDRDQF